MLRPLFAFVFCTGFVFAQQPAATPALSGAQWRIRSASDKPLTGQQRWDLFARNNFASPGAFTRTAIASVTTQISNRPVEWERSWSGFGKRVGTSVVTFTTRDVVEHGLTAMTGRDPRYQRCDCSGTWKRVGHSFKGMFASADASGKLRFDLSRVGAAYAGGYAAAAFYPKNYSFGVKGPQLGHRLAGQIVFNNLLAEFSPEISKIFRRRNKK